MMSACAHENFTPLRVVGLVAALLWSAGCHHLFGDFELIGDDASGSGPAEADAAAVDGAQVGLDAASVERPQEGGSSTDTLGTDSARPDGATPDLLSADGALPDGVTLDQGAVDAETGDGALLDAAALELPRVDSALSDISALDQLVADLGVPDALARDVSMLDVSALDVSAQDNSMLDVSALDRPTPDMPTPDIPMPDMAPPDMSPPDMAPPEGATSDLAPAETGPEDSAGCPPGFQDPPSCIPEPPVITVPIPSPTGWEDEQGDPIMLGFTSTTPGAVFKCRTAPVTLIGDGLFSNCDPVNGTLGVHYPDPSPSDRLDGRYRTEVRVEVDGHAPSPVVAFEYYVHSSLTGAVTCPAQAVAVSYFLEASRYLDTSDSFDSLTELTNPFITLDVTASTFPRRIPFGPQAQWDPNEPFLDYRLSNETPEDAVADTLSMLSLRRRFVLNSTETLLLIERTYISRTNPETVGCNTAIEKWLSCDSSAGGFPGTTDRDVDGTIYKFRDIHCTRGGYQTVPCAAIVMNALGNSVCLGVNNDGIVYLERLNPFFANGSPRGYARHFSDKTRDPEEAEANPEWLYLPD